MERNVRFENILTYRFIIPLFLINILSCSIGEIPNELKAEIDNDARMTQNEARQEIKASLYQKINCPNIDSFLIPFTGLTILAGEKYSGCFPLGDIIGQECAGSTDYDFPKRNLVRQCKILIEAASCQDLVTKTKFLAITGTCQAALGWDPVVLFFSGAF
ncbi:hypothetical protein CH352_07280 [Leptospira hartskeerlii]|uniref:Uncharacterized protein n=1 Tax=Leptospira hartskeerlii TaxID=2023177 RepID=A0A2M9XFE3_9LEPT|nr:hypothetical protein [Leptospira hartskeerlii]PJZ26364.1 hypothetical protein CH357_07685 [Leptospira hartskeerlii]PJZ34449.1 hypothetical protein CH352_07280 [Leptospira hartskeerlii]